MDLKDIIDITQVFIIIGLVLWCSSLASRLKSLEKRCPPSPSENKPSQSSLK